MSEPIAASLGDVTKGATRRPISWSVCVVVFFLGNVLLWSDRSNFSVAAAAWAKSYAWKPSTIGVMLSAFSFGYLIAQPIGGWIADKIGPRKSISASMAGWSLWVALTPIAPTLLWLTASFRVLLGISETPYIPSIVGAVAQAVPEMTRRGRFSALMQSGAQLGPAAGVFFAGLILSLTGSPSMIFYIFGAFGIACAGFWWLYASRYSDPAPSAQQANSPEGVRRASQAYVPEIKLLTSKRLWPLYIGYFALPYCQYIFLAWLPQYFAHYRHMTIANASFLSAFPFLVAFVAANVAGLLMDWFASKGWTKFSFHRKSLIFVGALTYAISTLAAANVSSTMLAVYLIMAANAGLAFYVYPFWTIVADMTSRQGGTLSGIMNFFGILGATLSPYVSGVIAEKTGAFVAPLELAAAIMLVAATTALLFLKIRPLNELIA